MLNALRKGWPALFLLVPAMGLPAAVPGAAQQKKERHFLYVVAPGIRNYLEFGGAGILVFDIDNKFAFVKRIETPASLLLKDLPDLSASTVGLLGTPLGQGAVLAASTLFPGRNEQKPENIKGVCACAATRKLYFTTLTKLYCMDLVTEKTLWEKKLPGGCDRMAITPDGKTLYVPSFEKDHWNVVDGATGDLIKQIVTKSGAHNTIVSLDGTQAYLAGLRSPLLRVVDCKTNEVVKTVGPFGASIRPFTVDSAKKYCYVNVNGLLGFEVGDLRTGEKVCRVEVAGVKKGIPKRHGCPSHGVGLTPDEEEVWVCDAFNSSMHVFDATSLPPKYLTSIKVREQPGWITFSRDGRWAYPSTGDVIEVKTKKIVYRLTDEKGREVHSEKVVEVAFVDGVPVWAGDQFGTGRK